MAILIRRAGEEWLRVGPAAYSDEAHLQQILHESPELIPLPGGDTVGRAFIREAGLPGSGQTDLLGVDSDGNIYIVECKLAANREIRRQVIGQVLEYAAFLWGMSFEEFDGLFVSRGNKSLSELLSATLRPEWSFDAFMQSVTDRLANGQFHLIVVVDEINAELDRIIQYVSSKGAGFRLEMLELQLYSEGDTEVLVPDLRGRTAQGTRSTTGQKRSLKAVFDACDTDLGRARLQQLVSEWTAHGNTAEPQTSGISFRAQVGDSVRHIFWAQNPNIATVLFNRLRSQGVPPDLIDRHRDNIAKIGGFDQEKVRSQSMPRAPFAGMTESDVMTFVQANQRLVDAWRKLPYENGM